MCPQAVLTAPEAPSAQVLRQTYQGVSSPPVLESGLSQAIFGLHFYCFGPFWPFSGSICIILAHFWPPLTLGDPDTVKPDTCTYT